MTGHYVTQWVAEKLGVTFNNCEAIGFAKNGKLIGGVVYHDYRKNYRSIQMSAASINRRWLSKDNLRVIFDYPFNQLQCNSVYACVSKENRHAIEFTLKVGFKPAGLLRKGFGTVDALLYDMLSEECKWSSHERLVKSTSCS